MKQKKEDRLFQIGILIIILALIAYSLALEPKFQGKQVASCGNSILDAGEQCDPAWTGSCTVAPAGQVPLVCNTNCQCQPQNAPGAVPYIEGFSRDIVRSPQTGYETVRISGANFINPSTGQPVSILAEGIPLLPTAYTVININAIDVRISPVMTPRSYHIKLQATNSITNQPLFSNTKMFTIVGRPSIVSTAPPVVPSNNQLNIITLTGTNFVPYNFEQTNVPPSEVIINGVKYNPTLVRVNGYAQIEILVPPYSPVGLYSIFVRNLPSSPSQVPAVLPLESTTVQAFVAPPGCGNTVIESGEQCDPAGSSCPQGGQCNSACQCPVALPPPSQPSTPSGGGGSGSLLRFDFNNRDTFTATVRRGSVIVAKIGTKSYSLRVHDVDTDQVTLKTPRDTVGISLEASENLLIDTDNTPDITAAVTEISRTLRASITLTKYVTTSPPSVPPPRTGPRPLPLPPIEPEPEPTYPTTFPEDDYFPLPKEEQRSPWVYVTASLIVIVLISAIAYAALRYMKRKKGKSSSFGFS